MTDADPCGWADAGSPPPEAFHVERIVDPFTQEIVVGMVRHPGRPAVFQLDGELDDAQAQRIGVAYLDGLNATLGFSAAEWIHADIRAALVSPRQAAQCSFGWLPVTWPVSPGGDRQPLGSFRADRGNANEATAQPRLLVLLAGSVDVRWQLQCGSDMGLRIVMHQHGGQLRIHGVTLAGLSNRRALEAVPAKPGRDRSIFDLVRRVGKVVSASLGSSDAVWINNLENACRPDTPANHLIAVGYALRWRKTGPGDRQTANTRARTYDFRVELAVDPGGDVQLVRVHRDLYIGAGAAATLSCFVQDAASNDREDLQPTPPTPDSLARRRSTRCDDDLERFRDQVSAELLGGNTLKYSDGNVDLFETRAASDRSTGRLGGRTVAEQDGVVMASRKRPAARSDQQAAIDAHLRAAEFFGRMQAYGLDAETYFRFARLPLVHRTRPAMRWAPDGELPNAEVRPFLGRLDGEPDADTRPSNPLQLLVNYGSADPVHRRKLPLVKGAGAAPGRVKAQYLSVASDPRWAWHEFGHVLNFASTGELEFPFAHSAGDALAAIATDPISRLAEADPEASIRHATYPWIEVPGRSHGRSPMRGYGWCGCRNLSRLNFTASLERYHHTYFGEQIMSSSLFRLYRSLGGDTRAAGGKPEKDDEQVRLSASDYCIYLIMRGISLLGPDTLAPARTADQFVSALIEADLGTGAWNVRATWPFNRDGRDVDRRGGRVHKVIRWAFEQQGLYATDDPRLTAEGPGRPPQVDVFIADRRRDDGDAGDGGYAPVPLRTGVDEPWHAHRGWLRREGGQLVVRVGNRGHLAAAEVGLRVWWMSAGAEGGPMDWGVVPVPGSCQRIGGGERVDFRLTLPDQAALCVLVSAEAPADPSNLAVDAALPASLPELLELVAHDNNLALAWL